MKKLLTYLFLILFVFQITSQLWVISCFYIHRDYIANNICVNRLDALSDCKGQCYLTQELSENEENQKKHFPDISQKVIQFFPLPDIVFKLKIDNHFRLSEKMFSKDINFHCSNFNDSVFHPPKQA